MSNFCILPWIHLEADANGSAKPCCLYEETVGNLNYQSIEEVWNSKELINLREKFHNNERPSLCKKCWDVEDSGGRSKRINELERFDHLMYRSKETGRPPAYLDLKLGRVCNIKCRTCNSFSSSAWTQDEKKLYGKAFNDNELGYWISDDMPVWKELSEILPYIEFIDFSGGEPLLIKKHFELLQKAVDIGCADKISLHYNTNGTIKPTEKMFEIWSKFKYVEIMLSADGIKERFEYLRHPAKWNTFTNTFEIFQRNSHIVHLTICHSVSALNVFYLDEFIDWCERNSIVDHNLYLNIIHEPAYYCIANLPTGLKEKITEHLRNKRCQEIVNFMNSQNRNHFKELLSKTEKLDNIRKETFADVFPEFWEEAEIYR
jgi:radical SAM protein with 4Fe4S-binding SPASM domain